jgi:hypothetical protein
LNDGLQAQGSWASSKPTDSLEGMHHPRQPQQLRQRRIIPIKAEFLEVVWLFWTGPIVNL